MVLLETASTSGVHPVQQLLHKVVYCVIYSVYFDNLIAAINITDGGLLIAQGAAAQFGFQEQVLAMWTLSVIARGAPWWAALASWSKKLRPVVLQPDMATRGG
ncbi:hypothetical protein EGR_10822 [Echinococcus granulosus]|uniref:Uncharacterized protein n=1 Tax=Echinococcus granulosus TaxID=6210 RepID=W6U1D8_ECHGR|nr:hypothetical protein EGR_10822 [Echinococcus granulosus]EUB54321.1 hypothetical protein EGR_10822 [Echinococcus granulosus]